MTPVPQPTSRIERGGSVGGGGVDDMFFDEGDQGVMLI